MRKGKHMPYCRQWVADGLHRLPVELVPLSEAPLTDLLKLDALHHHHRQVMMMMLLSNAIKGYHLRHVRLTLH